MTSQVIQASRHEVAETYGSQSILGFVRNALQAMCAHAANRRAERALREMDPRMLKDIGIDRSEIMSVIYTGTLDRRS